MRRPLHRRLPPAFSLPLAALLVAAPPVVRAEPVVSLSGDIEEMPFPSSLLTGQFVSQTHIRLLHEGPGTVTAATPGFLYDGAIHDPALPIAPGDNTFGNAITTPYAGPGLPEAGTEVYSVLLHFDPDVSGLPFSLTQGVARSAAVTFDQPILGVYVTSGSLLATDGDFAPDGVAYPTNAARDMEFNYDGDAFGVSPDRRTLTLTMFAHNGGFFDEARILLPIDPSVGVSFPGDASGLALAAPSPNPAAGPVRLEFTLPHAAHVRLRVLDVSGRVARVVADGDRPPGPGEAVWRGRGADGSPAPSGIYFVELVSGKNRLTRRIVRVR